MKSLSRVQLFATPWTVAYQAPTLHGILQARVLEWVAISLSITYSQMCPVIFLFHFEITKCFAYKRKV